MIAWRSCHEHYAELDCVTWPYDSRDVHDVVHKVVAIGSRSVESAQKFIDDKANGDKSIKAYGSYDEVFTDTVSLLEGLLRI